jgi:hypothetical protein
MAFLFCSSPWSQQQRGASPGCCCLLHMSHVGCTKVTGDSIEFAQKPVKLDFNLKLLVCNYQKPDFGVFPLIWLKCESSQYCCGCAFLHLIWFIHLHVFECFCSLRPWAATRYKLRAPPGIFANARHHTETWCANSIAVFSPGRAIRFARNGPKRDPASCHGKNRHGTWVTVPIPCGKPQR